MNQPICIIRRAGGQWEGVCLELGVVVKGKTFSEARDLLFEVVADVTRVDALPSVYWLEGRRLPLLDAWRSFLANVARWRSRSAVRRAKASGVTARVLSFQG